MRPKSFLPAALVLLASCATIMSGTTQRVGFASQPTGAKIFVDGMEMGVTPATIPLGRKKEHLVRIALDGYQPFEMQVVRSTNGWVWGNIVVGGLIGLGVDAVSGGLYKLNPEAVTASLQPAQTAGVFNGETLPVALSLGVPAGAEKIGQLTPVR